MDSWSISSYPEENDEGESAMVPDSLGMVSGFESCIDFAIQKGTMSWI